MKTTQTTTITKTTPRPAPKPQRQKRKKNSRQSQVLTKIVNTTANVASGTTIRNGPGAKMTSNGNVTRISHREFISDITAASTAFAAVNFAVNPGNATAFPWLSAIAANYESYTFKKLAYRYVPLCPTSTQGRITMALDYDARDSIPTSKAVLSQYQGAVATPVWQQGLYVAQPANLVKFAKQRYVSGATTPANSDVKTYHVGQFILATSNTPSGTTQLGELWVEYDVEFQTPQIATVSQVASSTERQPISGGAQRVKIGVRSGLPVFDTSFTDELHNILGQSWNYTDAGVARTKFSILFNKYLNHPVLYLIRYANVSGLKMVRTYNINTATFAPSLRQRGTSNNIPLGFSSVDLRNTIGQGISDAVNDETLTKRFLAFIAYPDSLSGQDGQWSNVASQLQFSYLSNIPNTESLIDIQSFALPHMMNSDKSNSVMVDTPSSTTDPNGTTTAYVETAGWLSLASQLSSYSSTTFRQVAGPDGEVKFKTLRQVEIEERGILEGQTDELSADLYHAIESVIKRIKDKAVIDDTENVSDDLISQE